MTTTFEKMLGRTLWLGVALSTALLAGGLVASFAIPGRASAAMLDAGLVVLMGTPMLRVVMSCIEYIRERDWFFAATAFGVLVVLGMTIYAAWMT